MQPAGNIPSPTGDAPRLMIVEDEFVVACDLCDTLESLGYAVVAVVGTGEEAVTSAASVRPTAILMDIRLAGHMDGIQAAARIRSEHDIPIVFLSAHSNDETLKRATAAEPFGYLIKPFRPAELRCALEVAIHNHRSQRRQIEDQARRLAGDLERRAAHRTMELETANQELEAFSYSVAHDLRAPLRGIASFSEILIQDYAEALDVEGMQHLTAVQRSARRMHLLIEDLLRLLQTSHGELRRDPVDLSRISHEVMDRLRADEPHRSVTVDIADAMIVAGDERLLRLVIENLLGNAWKFTSRRDEATIDVGMLRGEGEVCFVRDNGAGFDAGRADKLFTAFQRFHTMAEFEGTGLGLAIVQRILQRHGGRIWAESEVDAGATFYFVL
ncbi:MAG TPA: ATP-binding protein [Kofleriaceae bacterium]|jgi:signal transduction histidine kinase